MIPTKKNRLFILASAGMIIPATFLFSVVASIPHIFIIVCIGLIFSFFLRTPIKYSDRTIIYSVVVSLVLVVLLDMVFPVKGDRFLYIGRLLLGHITVPLLLYLAVCSTFYEPSPYTLGFSSAFSLVALMFGGDARIDVYNAKISPQGFFQPLLMADNFQTFFMITSIVVVGMALTAFYLSRKSPSHRSALQVDWLKRISYSVALIIVIMLTSIVLVTVKAFDQELRELESFLISVRYPDLVGSPGIIFRNDIDLNTTIRADRKKNRRMLMLRVVSPEFPPGYLRGKSYKHYEKGIWSIPKDEKRSPCKSKNNINKLALTAFFTDKDPGAKGDAVTIYPLSQCRSDFLFLPGNTERIEMVSDRLLYTEDGTFFPVTWESDAGYTARVPAVEQTTAYEEPKRFSTVEYLKFPPELKKTLTSISEEIFSTKTDKLPLPSPIVKKLSDRKKISEIIQFFNAEFSYSLQPEIPENGEDPLEFFMTKTRCGHCELFASSAAMLLRYQGIPCRYVTGFVCHSEHPSGQYYVARLGDAHAWVEAYLRDEKKWMLVDATPASSDDISPQWGFFESWYDRLKYSLSKILADARRGYIARALITAFVELFSFFWSVISHPLGGTLFFASALFLIWRYRLSKERKHSSVLLQLDKERRELQKSIKKLIKRTGKKKNMLRTSQMSLEEWLEVMRDSQKIDSDRLAYLEGLIRDYNQLRFSASPIPSEKLTEWKKRAANIKKIRSAK